MSEQKPTPMVEWVEPFSPTNEPVYCRVTENTAIEMQRAAGLTANSHYTYPSDAAALEDFIINHWACKVKSTDPTRLEPSNAK